MRSALVAMRQWSSRSRSAPAPAGGCSSSVPYSPMTVWVLPTSMASSTAGHARRVRCGPIAHDVTTSRPMSSTGALLVIGADGDEVDAGGGVVADGLEGDAAATPRAAGGDAAAPASSTARRAPRRASCCRAGRRRRRRRAPRRPGRGGRTRRGPCGPASAAAAARDGLGDAERGEVVVLEQHPVATGCRGGSTPPPARTAAFSRARSPGVVLRVSQIAGRPPAPRRRSGG